MKRIFISQPMHGKTEPEIMTEREKTIECITSVTGKDVDIIDSWIKDCELTDVNPLWFLGGSITLLSEADVAVFIPGWKLARGCNIEYMCCKFYGVPIIDLEEDDAEELIKHLC